MGFYNLAEKYCLPELQDIIIDTLIKYHKKRNELPSVDFVTRAFEQTSSGSPISRYCAQAILFIKASRGRYEGWATEDVARLFHELPTFAKEYLTAQDEMGEKDPRKTPQCYYHAHKVDVYCPGNPKRKRQNQEEEKVAQTKRPLVDESAESTEDESDTQELAPASRASTASHFPLSGLFCTCNGEDDFRSVSLPVGDNL